MTLALTILVSVLGSLLLSCGAFHSFGLTCFCYVLAGCHYSLIKSVQPDPASPLHGFNRLIVYSRSSVFCCLCALFAVSVLLIGGGDGGRRDACPSEFYFVRRYEAHLSAWPSHHEGIVNSQSPTLTLYGLSLQPLWLLCLLKDASGYLLLSFPLIFLFGLVPQINTLLAYTLEQVDVHVFGASGSANLVSAALSVVRSVVVIAICFGFCHAAVNTCDPQSFFFSLFWGLHLAMCFMMSRTPNNANIFHLLWTRMVSDAPVPPLRMQLLSCISSPVSFLSRHRLNRSCVSLFLRRCLMSLRSLFTAKTIARGTTVAKEDEGGVETPLSPACCVTETSRQYDQQTHSSVSPFEPGNTEKPLAPPGAPTKPQSQPMLTSPEFPGLSPRPPSPNSPLGDVSIPPQTVSAPCPSRVPIPNVPSPSSTPPLSNAMTSDLHDPLPDRIVSAMVVRIHNDLLVMLMWFILGSAVHLSTVFTVPALQPGLPRVLTWLTIVWGFVLHYVWPQLRKPFPWLLFTRTVFARPPDGRLTAFEVAYCWCHWLERYLLVPAVTMASVTQALAPLLAKFGKVWTTIILLITTMKLLRNGFSGATKMFLVLFFTEILFTCDFPGLSETLPVDYFFVSIIISKIAELWNKLSFVYIYTAPFQASWGSICHAVAQLASIPHFISILGNCVFSTLISAPLEPFVGSVFFITSYVRPIRFWEATQRLNRIESTTTSLYSQLRGVSFEQVTANLNAIFYEHLSRCLQQRLAGDIALGRWSGGNVQAGDIYILASEEQHFLLHIIEVGNGLVTFQTRGLEFAGTYCHEQESNCLTELHQADRGFCCCTLRNLPASVLSPNASVRLRWLAWQFVESHYTIEGYRLIDHSAATSLQVIDFRKIVVALFVQCLLYFTAWLPNLSNRLATLSDELNKRFTGDDKVDLDPAFTKLFDEDFDETVSGLTRAAFVRVYAEWIRYCLARSTGNEDVNSADESNLMTLCYAISLLGRRCLSGVSGHLNNTLDTFLHYLHDVFKGDVQIAPKDDWVFADLDLLKLVVTPAMRVALKLYQDHFTWNPLSTNLELYEAIWNTTRSVVICHETDPRWRSAVLNNAEKLFSFRKIDSGTTQQCFRFIMMNKQTLSFQVIKLNSECVRGFWAGQLREQIFLRNKNAERGSIQHAKHVLRNLINSSCDQPVGYPIYVSPLLTSFSESHHEYCRVACPNLSIPGTMRVLRRSAVRTMQRCRRWCLGSRGGDVELNRVQSSRRSLQRYSSKSCHQVQVTDRVLGEDSSLSSNFLHTTGDSDLASWCVEVDPNAAHTSSGTSFASSLAIAGRRRAPFGINTLSTAVVHLAESATGRVKITDPNQILNNCLFKLEWPSQGLLTKCLPQSACPLSILIGVEGILVHRWTPSNIDPRKRSFCHRNIALVAFPEGPITLEGHYVAIWEDLGLEFISENAQQ